jgi:L-lactate dehydrogenase complex protein LldG
MSEREDFMRQVRVALGHSEGSGTGKGRPPGPLVEPLEGAMAPVPPEELVSKFEKEFEALAGSPHRAATLTQLETVLRDILTSAGARVTVLSRHPLVGQLGLEEKLRTWGIAVSAWPGAEYSAAEATRQQAFREQAFAAAVGITGVDSVLAETGSRVLTSLAGGSQLASLAPPVHVALYRRSQVVESLDEVLAALPVSRDPSQPSPGRSVVFISGTSRTADIEQILVRGVHGPGHVHAILVEDSCLAGLVEDPQ